VAFGDRPFRREDPHGGSQLPTKAPRRAAPGRIAASESVGLIPIAEVYFRSRALAFRNKFSADSAVDANCCIVVPHRKTIKAAPDRKKRRVERNDFHARSPDNRHLENQGRFLLKHCFKKSM